MKLAALLAAALLLAGCSLGPPAPPASEDMREVKFWHDVARGVGCWIWYGSGRGGISCLPDAQYTSAPRSAPETPLSRPRVFAPVAAQGSGTSQGRTGAPSAGVAQSAEHSVTGYPVGERVGATPAPGLGAPLTPMQRNGPTVALDGGNESSVAFARTGIGTAAGAIRGTARWFATGPNGVAAAGPRLRAALGSHWRGTLVGVTYRGRTVWARLSDFCACGSGSIIDLPDEVFARFAPLSTGVLSVTVHWGDRNVLPATDTEP